MDRSIDRIGSIERSIGRSIERSIAEASPSASGHPMRLRGGVAREGEGQGGGRAPQLLRRAAFYETRVGRRALAAHLRVARADRLLAGRERALPHRVRVP